MKFKSLFLFSLCFVLFACGENFDVQPEVALEDRAGTLGPAVNNPPAAWFNIPTNFVLVSGSTKKANLNFGVSPNMSQVVTIKPKFSAKATGQSNFTPLPPIYQDLVIQPNTQLSNVITVDVADFGICADDFTMKMEVDEVRIGGVLIDPSEYNVLSFQSDGSEQLAMTGISCPTGGSGQPGVVKGDKFIAPKF